MRTALFGFVMILLPLPVMGQISPGRLHRSHAFLEGVENCTKCHEPDRTQLAERCLACHASIKERLQNGKGLHGTGKYRECQTCHVEHQGRDFDLIYWENGRDKFDHERTGYGLEGKHTTLKCNECHQPKFIGKLALGPDERVDRARTFLGLDTACASCHPDEHRGQLGVACQSCHVQQAWKPATGFDHRKTAFFLLGKHATVPCIKCHRMATGQPIDGDAQYPLFKPVSHASCTDCHTDPHKGKLGQSCRNCHNETGWRVTDEANFDHNRTRYPLEGRHASVACGKCHSPGRPKSGLRFAACLDCHSDFHKGQFANRLSKGACEECHTVAGFRPARFDMAQHDETQSPLRGSHRAVPCSACHLRTTQSPSREFLFKFASRECQACHADPHRGEVKRLVEEAGCRSCHNEESWRTVVFDHNRTEFALAGRHAFVACVKCHRGSTNDSQPRVVVFRGAAKTCDGCHSDVHRAQFVSTGGSTDCSSCHTSQNWKAEQFDHVVNARFALDGAHRGVPCQKCHPTVTAGDDHYVKYKPVDVACVSCHDVRQLPEGSVER